MSIWRSLQDASISIWPPLSFVLYICSNNGYLLDLLEVGENNWLWWVETWGPYLGTEFAGPGVGTVKMRKVQGVFFPTSCGPQKTQSLCTPSGQEGGGPACCGGAGWTPQRDVMAGTFPLYSRDLVLTKANTHWPHWEFAWLRTSGFGPKCFANFIYRNCSTHHWNATTSTVECGSCSAACSNPVWPFRAEEQEVKNPCPTETARGI